MLASTDMQNQQQQLSPSPWAYRTMSSQTRKLSTGNGQAYQPIQNVNAGGGILRTIQPAAWFQQAQVMQVKQVQPPYNRPRTNIRVDAATSTFMRV